MARLNNLEKLSFGELTRLRADVEALLARRQSEEKAALKQKLVDMAKAQGFDLDDVLGRKGRRGIVAVKYRDPENVENTWTGRGRMPRWMVAATKKRGVSKEDFLV